MLVACAGGTGLGAISCLSHMEDVLSHMQIAAVDRLPIIQFNKQYLLPALTGAGKAFAAYIVTKKERVKPMKRNIGAKLAIYPTPVYLAATYDRDGKANVMTVGWGGVCNSIPPCVCISVRPATHTYHALMERKAFTLNLATEDFTKEAAYCGRFSGKNVDKFKELGLTPIRSNVVDAPYIQEFPINLACKSFKSMK